MATEIGADHVELARDFLERSKSYLAQGDLHPGVGEGLGGGVAYYQGCGCREWMGVRAA